MAGGVFVIEVLTVFGVLVGHHVRSFTRATGGVCACRPASVVYAGAGTRGCACVHAERLVCWRSEPTTHVHHEQFMKSSIPLLAFQRCSNTNNRHRCCDGSSYCS